MAKRKQKPASKPTAAVRQVRAYEGANTKDGWRPRRAGASANLDHRADAVQLRARARSLVQNVPYIARALQSLTSATIGTGIEPVSRAESKRLGKQLNSLWESWSPVSDADGLHDIYGLQRLAYHAMEQDGEVLIRKRMRLASDGLPVPLQLQVLEADYIDTAKIGPVAGGGRIVSGKQFDALGRCTGYWLFESHPGDPLSASKVASKLVPASDIIHLFDARRPGQMRGITRLAPIIARSRDLMLYEDAVLARKNLESRLGVLASASVDAMGNPSDGATSVDAAKVADGDLGALPSGGITELPPGLNLTAFDPKPEGGTVEYLKWQLHLIASGIGVPYEALTGDMNEVNFSSARIRIIDFRRDVEQMQWTVLVPRMLNRIWQWFCEAANFTGLPIDTAVEWSTPRWDYVNPQQDINAEVEAIKYGLMTPSESLRRRGYKPEQVFAELGSDFAALKDSGALPFLQFMQGKPAADAEPTDPATPPKQGKRSAGDIPPMQLTLPAIHIHQSETRIEPPVVNVGGPTVNVERAEAPAVHVNVQPTPVTIDVQPAEVRADAPVIHVAAPNVTIQPAQVTVELEANIPPAEITLDLPTRKTTTDITRDSMGRIVSTTQIETDAE